MTGVLESMDGIAPADIAERWFARLMAPDCSLREREQFEAWLRQSPENAMAYEETKALWDSLGGLDEDESIGPYAVSALEPGVDAEMDRWARASDSPRTPTSPRSKVIWLPLVAGVAALLIVAVGALPLLRPQVPATPFLATAAIRDVRLADGSNVQLDLETSVSVRIGPANRDVELNFGRAMFEVAHDASRPFVVDAGAGRITALGTQFQVQRQGESISVTLLEGSVGIDSAEGGRHRTLRLVPGQQASYAPNTKSWTVATVDSAALTSWSDGFHVFSATRLSDAIAEVNRYSKVQLKLADPELSGLRLSGSFKLGKGEVIADALPYVIPVKVERRADMVIVSKR